MPPRSVSVPGSLPRPRRCASRVTPGDEEEKKRSGPESQPPAAALGGDPRRILPRDVRGRGGAGEASRANRRSGRPVLSSAAGTGPFEGRRPDGGRPCETGTSPSRGRASASSSAARGASGTSWTSRIDGWPGSFASVRSCRATSCSSTWARTGSVTPSGRRTSTPISARSWARSSRPRTSARGPAPSWRRARCGTACSSPSWRRSGTLRGPSRSWRSAWATRRPSAGNATCTPRWSRPTSTGRCRGSRIARGGIGRLQRRARDRTKPPSSRSFDPADPRGSNVGTTCQLAPKLDAARGASRGQDRVMDRTWREGVADHVDLEAAAVEPLPRARSPRGRRGQ